MFLDSQLAELYGTYVESCGEEVWKVYTSEQDIYVTQTRVNDKVVAELDRLCNVGPSHVVWLSPADAGLLALQQSDFREALKKAAHYFSEGFDILHVPNVFFVRPDMSFCWRLSVRIAERVSFVYVERTSFS